MSGNLPAIPLAIPNIGAGEAKNLQACVDTNFVSSVGPFVTEFEERVAALSGSAAGVAMGAGTQALHIALRAADIGPGDLVILPSFTFIASANAVSHSGATPWLMDIDSASWTLDPETVRTALKAHTEMRGGTLRHKASGMRVAAMMPVYTLGTPADMDALGSIASEYGLVIIADAAAAIGVDYRGQPIGPKAHMTCYSFNGNKTITCGGGGMVVGDDPMLMKRVRHLSTTARVSPNYEHDMVGYNYRMTNVQAAIGCAQLDRLNDFLAVKRRIRARYNDAFSGRAGLSVFPQPEDRESACWFSGLVLEDDALPPVNDVCARLKEHNIEARPFWMPVHMQAPYAQAIKEACPITEGVWQRILTLPCSTSLSPADQERVITAVEAALS
ncbi:aminotransferase class I/II-fold pyridoxal phosphate-dependent enzyme [Glycocaulis sp.]|uniref:aminotransferase class I/II-fold pyridoxal phosphate-dependent enzyme n=1 Tax=Glycocaulis sp. TaxID=1969725 RepID=UPI003D1EF229